MEQFSDNEEGHNIDMALSFLRGKKGERLNACNNFIA